ncbi:sensor histidine kinase [Spirosoma montaniterrae]|uniref:histidine kinase n=1 Tax=Spirosoma montaniterrae TaxID=1178516 RepID=A0A1P9WT50_9BACT|nr:ATP-binding protein [Spirosoma montaniterrae]AQG78571.1 PAS domain-containing sensor histidine kinase [Spirosoma montaniterrae]
MSIKTKISAALAFMFAIILALGGLGAFYLNQLSKDSQAILQDNYISLEYAGTMQRALADLAQGPNAETLGQFNESLKKQEKNITEVGEREATVSLRREFDRYRRGATDSLTVRRIQESLFRLDDINRQAIVRKNDVAKQTANDALLWLAVVGTLCFLILFSFIINFPGYIANPLRELTRGIKQVTSRNFEERLHFQSSDEFGELARSFNRMAEKLDEYEHSNLARVLFEKRRIDTLIQTMSEGIIGLDENRRILFANPVACRLLGIDQPQLMGKYAPDVAASNDLMRTLIRDIMPADGTRPDANNLLKIYDNGKESYFNKRTHTVDVTRTGEEQAQLAGYVLVLENITPYKELDLAKTNFIATVSHELKTPLSSIKMSLKLLEDSRIGTLNDEQRDLIGNVRADADRLLNLTSELLNMAQVESGQIQLNIQPVAPADIVQYATNALRVQAEQKQVRFAIQAPNELPAVKADPDKASWVLVNFLSNAVRHSPDETVIDVSATLRNGHVEFRVRDYGAGIRPEHRDRVFDRYFKAPGQNGQASGTGLGLAISSEFIQSMNGAIGLDATVTDGAAFYFRLPVA